MYLLVFRDGKAIQLNENLSAIDYLSVQQGILQVFRRKDNKFARLVIDNGRACWVPVSESRLGISGEARLHF